MKKKISAYSNKLLQHDLKTETSILKEEEFAWIKKIVVFF